MPELFDIVAAQFPEIAPLLEDPAVYAVALRATGQVYALSADGLKKTNHFIYAAKAIREIIAKLAERGGDPREIAAFALEYIDREGNRILRIAENSPAATAICLFKANAPVLNSVPWDVGGLGPDVFQWLTRSVKHHGRGFAVIGGSAAEREAFIETLARQAVTDRDTVFIGARPRVYTGSDVPVYFWRGAGGNHQPESAGPALVDTALAMLPRILALGEIGPDDLPQLLGAVRSQRTRIFAGLPFSNPTALAPGLQKWTDELFAEARPNERVKIIAELFTHVVAVGRTPGGAIVPQNIKSLIAQGDRLTTSALFAATPLGLLPTEAGRDDLQNISAPAEVLPAGAAERPLEQQLPSQPKIEMSATPRDPVAALAPVPEPVALIEPAPANGSAKGVFSSLIEEASLPGKAEPTNSGAAPAAGEDAVEVADDDFIEEELIDDLDNNE